MSIKWGLSVFGHDASLSVSKNNKIVFASNSERFSKIKNDSYLNNDLIKKALSYGIPNEIIFHEKLLIKKLRQLYAGEYYRLKEESIKNHLKKFLPLEKLKKIPIISYSHHFSHACNGFYTSNFDNACIVVVDSIGEWETITVWEVKNNNFKKIYSQKYPHSLGLLYSAFTHYCELKPNEEEYILMGMSTFGNEKYYYEIYQDFIKSSFPPFKLNHNLHKGCRWWNNYYDYENIAASIQNIFENELLNIVKWSKKKTNSENLILTGGTALNCKANTKILNNKIYKNIWIPPNPGDGGNSLGCLLAHEKNHFDNQTPYLGYNIDRKYPKNEIVNEIIENKLVGVANGRAEFSPRALGNRSLLADPRYEYVKDRVNNIKKRQKFRPFAPIILEEFLHDYFHINLDITPYMLFLGTCKFPEKFPAIVHNDNTSRIQTINKKQHKNLYETLYLFYNITGCPMLLNTSLNIKGMPIVNDEYDAKEFSKKYSIKVF